MIRYVNSFISVIIAFMMLILWVFTYKYTCFSLIFPIISLTLISKNSFELLKTKKICNANCYLNKNSFIYTLLTGRIFIFIFSLVISIIITTSLFIYAITFNIYDIIIVILSGISVIVLYNKYQNTKIFSENVKNIFVKNIAVFTNTLIFTIILVVININQTPPSFIDNNLLNTITNASKEVYSVCPFNQIISKVTMELQSIKWWIMVKFSINNHNEAIKIIVWLLFLISNYLVILGFSKLVLEVNQIGEKLWNNKKQMSN